MASVQRIEGKKGISYRIRVGAGYDSEGKQIRKSMTWCPSPGMTEKQIEKELNRVTIDFEKKVENGLVFENVKFKEFSEKWINDYVKKQCSPKYLFFAERLLVDINREIGHIPLQKLKKAHLQELYSKLASEPRILEKKVKDEEGKTVTRVVKRYKSPSTILHYHKIVSTILTKATQWDYISHNICLGKGIELPKRNKPKPKYLQDDEVLKLVDYLENAPIEYRTFIMLLLYTGLRTGEAMGLEWIDIDFDNNLISVNRASQYISGKGIFTKETKNTSSERVIRVAPEVMALLKQYKAWQNEQRLKVGPYWKANPENAEEKHCDNWNLCKQRKDKQRPYCPQTANCNDYKNIDRLFTQFNGIPMHPDTVLRWLKRFIAKTDLPDFNIHSLRHTNVSLMIMQGVPLPTVAKLAGHSTTATTIKIYSHSIKTAEQMAADLVANVINPARQSK
jgi:integrase